MIAVSVNNLQTVTKSLKQSRRQEGFLDNV